MKPPNESAPATCNRSQGEKGSTLESKPQVSQPVKHWTEVCVSMVDKAVSTATKDAEVGAILEHIKGDKWREPVEHIRAEYRRAFMEGRDPKQAVKGFKKARPGVLWSGAFTSRCKEGLVTHSGILCADLDGLDHKLEEVRAKLIGSPYALAVFLSITATGLKVLFRVAADASDHLASFYAVEKHVLELTGVQIDPACKDVPRLCFVSYDPDLWIRPDEPQQMDCTHRTQAHIATEDTESHYSHNTNTVSRGETVGRIVCIQSIDEAIEVTLPRNAHTSHKLLYKLCGALLACEETTGRTTEDTDLRGIFDRWYERAKPNMQDGPLAKDEYFLEFLDAWENIQQPLCESPLNTAWRLAQNAPIPPEAEAAGFGEKSGNICRFIAFVRELQKLNGDAPFFLSPYDAARLFGQRSHTTAASWLGGLCALKILTRVAPGEKRKRAATYRFNFQKSK